MRLFLFVLLNLSVLSGEAKTLHLATFSIPLMVESGEQGLFIEMTRLLAQDAGFELQVKVLSPGQAVLDFSNNKFDGMFPALDVSIPKSVIKSAPFYNKIDYVFFKKQSPLKTLKDLEGKKVGLTFRYPYAKELTNNKKILFQFANDDVTNMQKLGRGEIDAFVVEEKSGLKALQQSKQPDIDYDKTSPLSDQTVYFAFQDNKRGKELAEKFSKAIEKMQKTGQLEKIFSPVAPIAP